MSKVSRQLPLNALRQHYLEILDNTEKEFDKSIQAAAENFRTNVMIPLCKKYNLSFTSGMGTFFFSDKNGNTFGDVVDLKKSKAKRAQELVPVLELLNHEVSHNQCFGYFVADINLDAEPKPTLKLYVWEGVLTDYTSGIAFALAESEEEARNLLLTQLGWSMAQCKVNEPALLGPARCVESAEAFHLWGGG